GADGQSPAPVPTPEGTLQPTRRHHVRRRTANARNRPRADEQTQVVIAGRALTGTGTDHNSADFRDC
nr:hypothetical protein [Tanacetum cinerariifolium]